MSHQQPQEQSNNNNAITVVVSPQTDNNSSGQSSVQVVANNNTNTPTAAAQLERPLLKPNNKKEHDLITIEDDSWYYAEKRPVWLNSILLIVLIICGGVEGYAMNQTGLGADPLSITQQFTFKSWIVLCVFLAAVGASLFFQGLLEIVAPSLFDKTRSMKKERAGYARAVIGGLGVGAGLAICGAGPTILPAQLGASAGNAWVTTLGMLAGGVVYAVFDHFFGADIACPLEEEDKAKINLDERMGVRYWKLALPLGAVLFAVGCALNFTVMNKEREQSELTIGRVPWPGIAAGLCIGIFQIAYRLIGNRAQGGATSVMVFVSTLTWGKLAPKQFPDSFAKIWQPAFVWVGSTLGSLVARMTTEGMKDAEGLNVWRSFVGGFVVLFFARVGNSCTCGAISSSSETGVEGMIIAAGVFIGGIAVGWILVAAGAQTGV